MHRNVLKHISVKIIETTKKAKTMNILVTGSTGHLGTAVIETLLKKIPANQISALVRKTGNSSKDREADEMQFKGLNVVVGNYDDVHSMEMAMTGIETVLLISATDEGDRKQQHRNVVDAAKKMGVQCIAYTSRSLRNNETLSNKLMLEHFETEAYIANSGLQYTIFRNALYMDVLPLFVGKQVFERGIFQPAAGGKVAFALRKEMGEAIANVLVDERCDNKTYKFTGSEAYSFYDVAAVLSNLSGKDVRYTPTDSALFREQMKENGLPELMVNKIVEFNTDISNGQEDEITTDLENNLGRKPTTLSEGLKTLFGFQS
jgi:NAD(P)H dehydrogenase (quinone)